MPSNAASSRPVRSRPWRPRVTVATVIAEADRYLVVEELIRGKAVLNQPAGHLEAGESLVEAACRETLEEAGCEVEIQGLIAVYQWPAATPDSEDMLRFTFAGRLLRHDPERSLDEGILGIHWLRLTDLISHPRLRSPLVIRSIEDYLSQPLLPLNRLPSLL